MARLQILEFPKGPGDDRPPFMLVIDEVADDETERIIDAQEAFDGIVKKVGARAVAIFHGMTVDIPANGYRSEQPPAGRGDGRARQHEAKPQPPANGRPDQYKAAITDALGMDRLRDWDDILNAAAGLRKDRDALTDALERVRNLPEQPEIMNALHSEPRGYLHGYEIAIRDAKRAAQQRTLASTSPEPSLKDG